MYNLKNLMIFNYFYCGIRKTAFIRKLQEFYNIQGNEREKVPSRYTRVYIHKFEGVYYYDSTKRLFEGGPDRCYVVTFKVAGCKVWKTVGWKSQGVTPQTADAFRAECLREIRLGAPMAAAGRRREKTQARNRTIEEIFSIYFTAKGDSLKGRKTDKNRYRKHIAPLFEKRRVSDITPLCLERLKQSMAGRAEGTKRNALELLRRVINFGAKAGLCRPLPFSIEMPGLNGKRLARPGLEKAALQPSTKIAGQPAAPAD